nr:DTW domain-containing protein [Variovorax sp. N23]
MQPCPPLQSHAPSAPRACARSAACICRWVAPTAHAVEVVVLRHPLEVYQAKGSAHLLHLSLADCRLVVGEAFAAPVCPIDSKHTLLLYPDSPRDTAPDLRVPSPLPPEWPQAQSRLRLVVLDGLAQKPKETLPKPATATFAPLGPAQPAAFALPHPQGPWA